MKTYAKGMRSASLCDGKYSEGEKMMKRKYENIEIKLIFLCDDDIIRTSQNDNVQDLPDFPENFEP